MENETSKHVPETPIEKLKEGDKIIIDHFNNEGEQEHWEFGEFVRLNNDGTFIARPIDFDDKRKYLKEETFKNKQYFGRV